MHDTYLCCMQNSGIGYVLKNKDRPRRLCRACWIWLEALPDNVFRHFRPPTGARKWYPQTKKPSTCPSYRRIFGGTKAMNPLKLLRCVTSHILSGDFFSKPYVHMGPLTQLSISINSRAFKLLWPTPEILVLVGLSQFWIMNFEFWIA